MLFTAFDRLRDMIMSDEYLMAELTGISDRDMLFARVIELGRSRGIEVSVTDLDDVVRGNRQSWLQRWVPA